MLCRCEQWATAVINETRKLAETTGSVAEVHAAYIAACTVRRTVMCEWWGSCLTPDCVACWCVVRPLSQTFVGFGLFVTPGWLVGGDLATELVPPANGDQAVSPESVNEVETNLALGVSLQGLHVLRMDGVSAVG